MNAMSDLAPELQVQQWFNASTPPTLESLRGRVVLLHAFQMLCPGCVSHGLPQATRVHQAFARSDVVVLGLHTVFEHHPVMNPEALAAFIHEYRLEFPIAVDLAAGDGPIPLSMRMLGLRGTPSLVLIDRSGRIRLNHFGRIDDLELGAMLGALRVESTGSPVAGQGATATGSEATPQSNCDADACGIAPR